MGRELAITVNCTELLACNLCGGVEHTPMFRKRGFELVRCAGCGLAFIANPPRADEVAGLYSAAADYHGALLDPVGSHTAASGAEHRVRPCGKEGGAAIGAIDVHRSHTTEAAAAPP